MSNLEYILWSVNGYLQFQAKKVSLKSLLRRVSDEHVDIVTGSGAYALVYPKKLEWISHHYFSFGDHKRAIDKQLKKAQWYKTKPRFWIQTVTTSHMAFPPLLIRAPPGFVLLGAGLQKPFLGTKRIDNAKGISGYVPSNSDMWGVFMARGPGFQSSNQIRKPIKLVDLYLMFCHLLDITPASKGHAKLEGLGSLISPRARILLKREKPSAFDFVKLV